ncbi:MAG: type I-C CRISPR-associated endonuclease Cas1c [Actinomycetota bacterium]|nr:type I-C CRISPR-associated endonuclease Cas1c [Actinomycetota bacterium]
MKKLLNTLYIFTEDAYLSLDGENVVVRQDGQELGRIPLHTLENILCFSRSGASPALMGACASHGISLSFFDVSGRYLAGVIGEERGNVLLRQAQYAWADDEKRSLEIARFFIVGKLYNSRWVLERYIRDHALRLDVERMRAACKRLAQSTVNASQCGSADVLRGIEGDAAAEYFSALGQCVLRNQEVFALVRRTRRPPTDSMNAMLSLFYTVLMRDCASALEGVGLDPYVGFLHVVRPGRKSLALDLMEELRAVIVDRFVLAAVNNRVVNASHFDVRETGEVLLMPEGRKALFEMWQNRKRETLVHPFLKEKIQWGLVPHAQALLLARCMRGDLDGYPPFLWK